jgi:hypothetical protein
VVTVRVLAELRYSSESTMFNGILLDPHIHDGVGGRWTLKNGLLALGHGWFYLNIGVFLFAALLPFV